MLRRTETSGEEPEVATRKADTTDRDANRQTAEPRRRVVQSDVGTVDEIIPRQMRGHAPFDEARDVDLTQEGFNETGPSRWRDEDRLTNRSGDPRIGTHGRKYEP